MLCQSCWICSSSNIARPGSVQLHVAKPRTQRSRRSLGNEATASPQDSLPLAEIDAFAKDRSSPVGESPRTSDNDRPLREDVTVAQPASVDAAVGGKAVGASKVGQLAAADSLVHNRVGQLAAADLPIHGMSPHLMQSNLTYSMSEMTGSLLSGSFLSSEGDLNSRRGSLVSEFAPMAANMLASIPELPQGEGADGGSSIGIGSLVLDRGVSVVSESSEKTNEAERRSNVADKYRDAPEEHLAGPGLANPLQATLEASPGATQAGRLAKKSPRSSPRGAKKAGKDRPRLVGCRA